MHEIPCVLTIAGSDSGGGAGIQADLKTIAMNGGYGASVITALTAQNTTGVAAIHASPAEFVGEQMEAVLSDIDVKAAKTGMLFSEDIIKAVARFLFKRKFKLVVDPVCVATSGSKLLEDSAIDAMRDKIFPHADLLTPNIPEAELFTGMTIRTAEDIEIAAGKLLDMGPKSVLIKGGHLESVTSTDWFAVKGHRPIPFLQQRVDTDNTHGTGCTLSAAIATYLGRGFKMTTAIRKAQAYLNNALRAGYDIGEGSGPPNHIAPLLREQERPVVVRDLVATANRLSTIKKAAQLVPEERMQVAVALSWAAATEDIAGHTVGISALPDGRVVVGGCPEFGAAGEVGEALRDVQRILPHIRCAVNIAWNGTLRAIAESSSVAMYEGSLQSRLATEVSGLRALILALELDSSENDAYLAYPGGGGQAFLCAKDCKTLLSVFHTLANELQKE